MFTAHRADKNTGTTRKGRMVRMFCATAIAGGLTAGLVAVAAPANAAPAATQAAVVQQSFGPHGRGFDRQPLVSTNVSTNVAVQAQLGARDRRSGLDATINLSLGLAVRIL